MAAVNEQILQIINSLPDDVTVDDFIAELYFKLQVDAGLTELDEGKRVSHKKVEERMAKWN